MKKHLEWIEVTVHWDWYPGFPHGLPLSLLYLAARVTFTNTSQLTSSPALKSHRSFPLDWEWNVTSTVASQPWLTSPPSSEATLPPAHRAWTHRPGLLSSVLLSFLSLATNFNCIDMSAFYVKSIFKCYLIQSSQWIGDVDITSFYRWRN